MRILSLWLSVSALTLGACDGDKSETGGGGSGNGGSGGEDENHRPIADAGSDVTQETLAAVGLDGRGSSDPDGDTLTFYWTFDRVPDGSVVTEREAPFSENATTETGTTFRPDVVGTYIVKLVVKDEAGMESRPDYAVVTITDAGAPIANAGSDHEGAIGDTFTLDGSDSYDPGGGTLTYSWSIVSEPSGSSSSLSDSASASTSLTADKAGLYIASLIVNNGVTSSEPDTTVVLVSSSAPEAPVANAGDDQSVSDCMSATLDGSGSYDASADDDELTYLWSIQTKPSGSAVSDEESFADRTDMSTTFFPDIAGTYLISLAVFNGYSWSTPDVMTLTASERTFNSEPVVEAGMGATHDGGYAECEEGTYAYDCDECTSVIASLGGDAAVSDGDGDPYTVSWSVVSGSATISDSDSMVTTVTMSDATPTEPEACESNEYVFQLAATDCPGETATDTVTLTVSCCGVAEATETGG